MKNLFFSIRTSAVLLFLLTFFSQSVLANFYPSHVSVINNTDYPFVIVDKLAKLRINLPPHGTAYTTISNTNDTKFILNSFIVAKGEQITPTYAMAAFLQIDCIGGDWYMSKAFNYPVNFPDPESQIYCDKNKGAVCFFNYNAPAFTITVNYP